MDTKGDHGLRKQIKYVRQTIRIKEELGKDISFEKGLIEEWRRYLPGGDKHHLWLAYSRPSLLIPDLKHHSAINK